MSDTEIDVALAAAAAGAAAAKQRYCADLAYLPKSATDFPTEVDLAAEEAVRQVIANEPHLAAL